MIREDTELSHFPLFCPKCRYTCVVTYKWNTETTCRVREFLKEMRIPIRMPSDDMFFQNMYHLPHRDWKWGLKRGVLFDALLGLYLSLHEECIPEKDTHLRDTWMRNPHTARCVWNLPGR